MSDNFFLQPISVKSVSENEDVIAFFRSLSEMWDSTCDDRSVDFLANNVTQTADGQQLIQQIEELVQVNETSQGMVVVSRGQTLHASFNHSKK